MLLIAFLIPVITCIILFVVPFFRSQTTIGEYFMVFIPTILVSVITFFGIEAYVTTDTEYLGFYTTKVEYYERWNEYIHQTCTRSWTDSDGNTHSETYDCSYVDNHPPRWYMYLNNGKKIYIDKKEYRQIVQRFGVSEIFHDMHRHYHTIDGDMYYAEFPGDRNRMYTCTFANPYTNKILRSKSIFNFSDVQEEDLDKVLDYQKVYRDQNPITGNIAIPRSVVDSFKYLNAYYGGKYQFRCYVWLWKDKPLQVSKLQQDFLVGGNKNELNVCISVDSTTNKIQWVNAFSWEDSPKIQTGVNHLYSKGEVLDLMKLNRYLLDKVPSDWKRKNFSDFDYIKHELNTKQWIIVYIFTIIASLGLSIFVIFNDLR